MKNIPIGQILLEEGYITQSQLNIALERQKANPEQRIGEIMINLGYINEKDLLKVLGRKLNMKYVDLSIYQIDNEAVKLIPEQIARQNQMIAIAKKDKVITVATSNPLNIYLEENVKIITGMRVNVVLATYADIQNAIDRCYSQQVAKTVAEKINEETGAASGNNISDIVEGLDEKIDSTPIVKLVNSILMQAYKIGASDIHIEPFSTVTKVRMRVDGDLIEQMRINVSAHNTIITRLKILGGMNIAEKRLPQDGGFEVNINGNKLDLRLSSLPTIHGEKMVIRLLNSDGGKVLKLEELGMNEKNLLAFKKAIKSPNGIILVTGPTGSGKTTTLCAALGELSKPNVNIITLEDPVEKQMPDINQVQINYKAGLTFAEGLKSILRQDPDIIMVGEIRDAETAQIAIRAAITGHLVLSTLHTNDAASSISRLIDMGVEPFLVSASLVAVMAQRLIKKLCPDCKKPYESTNEDMKLLEIDQPTTLYAPVGCPRCNGTGYKGRTAIHEIILVNEKLKNVISKGASSEEIRKIAKELGVSFLKDNAIDLAKSGITSVQEVYKVCFSLD